MGNGSCLMKSVSFLVRTDYLLNALKGHIYHTDFVMVSQNHILIFMIQLALKNYYAKKFGFFESKITCGINQPLNSLQNYFVCL